MYVYKCVCVCMYVCMYVCIYIYIYIVNRGQREQKGSFREYPKAKCVLVECRGSFRGYP